MKTLPYIIIFLLLPVLAHADLCVKQVDSTLYLRNETTCLIVSQPNGSLETQAHPQWTDSVKTAKDFNWKPLTTEQAAHCILPWRVKPNARRTDGARPIRDPSTGKYTGEYILPKEPCGDHVTGNPENWRYVPGGMTYCDQYCDN